MPHAPTSSGGGSRRPLARATLIALAVVLVATAAMTLVTRDVVERAQQRVLAARVRDLAGTTKTITEQLSTTLGYAALASREADGDPARFTALVAPRLGASPLHTIVLLPADGSGRVLAVVGGAPRALAQVPGAALRRTDEAPAIVISQAVAGTRVIGYAEGDGDGFVIYAELSAADVGARYFGMADGIEGSIYIESPFGRQFLASNVPGADGEPALAGDVVEEEFPLVGGFRAVAVAVARRPLLDRRVRIAPWLVLGLGLAVALAVAVLVETAQRRRDRALGLARELGLRATHDELTGLGNRRLLDEHAAAALAAGGDVSLVLVDLDDFKLVNDVRGHDAGDDVLREVARRLVAAAGPGCACARLGGDEFAVVAAADADAAVALGRRLLASLSAPVRVQDEDLRVRASVGIATATPGATPETLLRDADLAMYATKRDPSGARLRRFDRSLLEDATRRHRLALDLRGAAARGELELRYQPDRPLSPSAVPTAEVLLRWRHPREGLLSPERFLADAERSGEIVAIGDWVLRTSLRALLELRAIEPRLRLALNASRRELLGQGFADRLAAALAGAGLPPDAIALEVNESAFADRDVEPVIAAVLAGGTPVALDDFGAAHSSLHVLGAGGIRGTKVDRALTPSEPTEEDERFLTALVEMLHARGQFVVAEGVETEAAAAAVEAAGFDAMQGSWLTPPLTLDGLMAWLSARRAASAGSTSA